MFWTDDFENVVGIGHGDREPVISKMRFRKVKDKVGYWVLENLCSRKFCGVLEKQVLEKQVHIEISYTRNSISFRRLFPVSDEFSDEFRPLPFILTTRLETTIFTSCFWHKGHKNDVFIKNCYAPKKLTQ